jgi:molybdopterin converting factor small subunit
MTRIRVALPAHLRTLARTDAEVVVDLAGPATVEAVLDALELRYPMLRGTIREHGSHKRRSYLRYFACGEDISFEPTDRLLATDVLNGTEPLIVLGAIAGG